MSELYAVELAPRDSSDLLSLGITKKVIYNHFGTRVGLLGMSEWEAVWAFYHRRPTADGFPIKVSGRVYRFKCKTITNTTFGRMIKFCITVGPLVLAKFIDYYADHDIAMIYTPVTTQEWVTGSIGVGWRREEI